MQHGFLHFLFIHFQPTFHMEAAKKLATRPFKHHNKQQQDNTSATQQTSTTTTAMTSTSLLSKVALVTGGSKGIGRATCLALAKAGASVVINYSSDSSSADSLVKEIGADRAYAVKADAGSVQGAQHMVKEAIGRFGGLDLVVANAGMFSRPHYCRGSY